MPQRTCGIFKMSYPSETQLAWLEEHYPIYASNCPKGEEVAHSILKWSGLNKLSYEEQPDALSGLSCALCHRFAKNSCKDCPITIAQGFPCDKDAPSGTFEGSAFQAWIDKRDAAPMLEILRKCTEIP
jgi:hypothetical protein